MEIYATYSHDSPDKYMETLEEERPKCERVCVEVAGKENYDTYTRKGKLLNCSFIIAYCL